ncbi:hypothetical protein GQ600_3451 [Phytophthora cactorum]|nr:hypothetical protein GQ600_3451 [Phytophthora cactorum]
MTKRTKVKRRGDHSAGREAMKMKDGYDDEDDGDAKYRLDVHAIDAFWLQRELSKFYKDARLVPSWRKTSEYPQERAVTSCLRKQTGLLLDYDNSIYKLLLENRAKVLYSAYDSVSGLVDAGSYWRYGDCSRRSQQAADAVKKEGDGAPKKKPQHYVDVESLAFQEGGHLMSNRECRLPEGTWRAQRRDMKKFTFGSVDEDSCG